MKLYKYRPINQLLFKELYYREIYLARFIELNDPLDMDSIIDFKSTNNQEIKTLIDFILRLILRFGLSISREGIQSKETENKKILNNVIRFLKDEDDCNWLANAIHHEFQNIEGIVTINELCRILLKLNNNNKDKLNFIKYVDAFRKEIEELSAVFFKNSSTACFSESNNDFLMWSHYADRHSGICLEFSPKIIDENTCTIPFSYNFPSKEDPKTFEVASIDENVQKVIYIDKPYCTSFYDYIPLFANAGDIDLHLLSKSYWHQYADKLKGVFTHKLKHWNYEKEWRIVYIEFKNHSYPEERIFRYNEDALTGVIFGNRTDANDKHRIYNIINSGNVQFYESLILEDSSIEIVPINESFFELDELYY